MFKKLLSLHGITALIASTSLLLITCKLVLSWSGNSESVYAQMKSIGRPFTSDNAAKLPLVPVPKGINQWQCHIPYELVHEVQTDSAGARRVEAKIFLSKHIYSRDNLSQIFTCYSQQYSDRQIYLNVRIYTNRQNIMYKEYVHWDKSVGARESNVPYEAIFQREPWHSVEWYIYNTNPDDPNKGESKIVILKGVLPFRHQKPLEAWQVSNGMFDMRIRAYELPGVSPDKIYYTLESSSGSSKTWHSLFSTQHDSPIITPRHQMQFISESIGYGYLDQFFAVTVDSGKSWNTWRPDNYPLDFQCCKPWIIESVNIDSDGSGWMTIGTKSEKSYELKMLVTQDYGQHWVTK